MLRKLVINFALGGFYLRKRRYGFSFGSWVLQTREIEAEILFMRIVNQADGTTDIIPGSQVPTCRLS